MTTSSGNIVISLHSYIEILNPNLSSTANSRLTDAMAIQCCPPLPLMTQSPDNLAIHCSLLKCSARCQVRVLCLHFHGILRVSGVGLVYKARHHNLDVSIFARLLSFLESSVT